MSASRVGATLLLKALSLTPKLTSSRQDTAFQFLPTAT